MRLYASRTKYFGIGMLKLAFYEHFVIFSAHNPRTAYNVNLINPTGTAIGANATAGVTEGSKQNGRGK